MGIVKCAPEALIRAFARLMRCATVASGTRNAEAISAVVRPPTARNVSAIADADVRSGWQHRKSSIRVSSWPLARLGSGLERRRGILAPAPGLLAAHLVGQAARGHLQEPAARIVRAALGRPMLGRCQQRLLDGVLGGGEVARAPREHAEDLRRQLAQQVPGVSVDDASGQSTSPAQASGSGAPMI